MYTERHTRERKKTAKWAVFAAAYVETGNATQSAIKAGYSERSAAKTGHQLLREPKVQEFISSARQKLIDKAEVNAEWVIQRLKEEAASAENPSARVKALDLLAKHLGIYAPEQSQVTVNEGFFADIGDGETSH